MSRNLKLYYFLANVLTLIVMLANNALVGDFTSIYYATCIISLVPILFLAGNEKKKHNIFALFLYLVSIVSFTFNDVDPVFQSFFRFAIFSVISILVGPLISSKSLSLYRHKLLTNLLVTLVVIVLGSFVLTFAGLYKGFALSQDGSVQMYQGLFSHTMVMSPMAGISFLVILSYYLKPIGFLQRFKAKRLFLFHVVMILGLIISFFSSIMAGSRSAVGALIIACVFFFIVYSKFKIFKFSKIILPIIILLVFSFPLWKNKTTFLVGKIENNQAAGSSTASRDSKWNQRIDEFLSSPIYGIGFASIDPNGEDEYNRENGQIEPGTSWLAILSMTGIIGFGSVLCMFYYTIIKLCKNYLTSMNMMCLLLISILTFFSIHMIAEGYFLSSGSLSFFMVWLCLGVSQSYIHKNQFS